eukprot:4507553-Alexandrium_andersonii.AAC.1
MSPANGYLRSKRPGHEPNRAIQGSQSRCDPPCLRGLGFMRHGAALRLDMRGISGLSAPSTSRCRTQAAYLGL